MPPGASEWDFQPEYVAARAVLLDALQALEDHLPAIIMVGAQAVYLHTGAGDLLEPPMTTDGDLALDVALLATEPEITAALGNAEFKPGNNPGRWLGKGGVAVDLMVVPAQSGRTKKNARAARLSGHANIAARITPGLEPALVDHARRTLTALDPNDRREVELNVAGPAALLIAKAVKIQERLTEAGTAMSSRVKEKDAFDIFRLLQAVQPADLAAGLRRHLDDDTARDVTARGVSFLEEHGATQRSLLPTLATAATGEDPTVAPSLVSLLAVLLGRMREG